MNIVVYDMIDGVIVSWLDKYYKDG